MTHKEIPEKKRATIEDVAGYCDLSRATVSRVINKEGNVKPSTTARVDEAIKELGYVPNYLARGLTGGKKNIIAILLPDITIPYYANLLESADEVAENKSYHLLIQTREYKKSVLNLIEEQRADGFIIRNSGDPAVDGTIIKKLNKHNLPFVFIGKPLDLDSDIFSIGVDNVGGARKMAHHFVEHGFRKILFISGPEKKIDSGDRIYGFKIGLSEKGVDPESILNIQGDFTREGGYGAAEDFFSKNNAEAVFAANDQMALGLLHYFYENSINVPKDIAVAGFDDAFFAEFLCPSLTTVRQPMSEIGAVAVESIILRLEGSPVRKSRIILPTQLIARESCGCNQKLPGKVCRDDNKNHI